MSDSSAFSHLARSFALSLTWNGDLGNLHSIRIWLRRGSALPSALAHPICEIERGQADCRRAQVDFLVPPRARDRPRFRLTSTSMPLIMERGESGLSSLNLTKCSKGGPELTTIVRGLWVRCISLYLKTFRYCDSQFKIQQKSVTVTPSGTAKKCCCKGMAYTVSLQATKFCYKIGNREIRKVSL